MSIIIAFITDRLNAEDYGIENLIEVGRGIPAYKHQTLYIISAIFNSKAEIEILESLRKCKSWKDIINFKDKFIEIFLKIDREYESGLMYTFTAFTNEYKKDEGVLF